MAIANSRFTVYQKGYLSILLVPCKNNYSLKAWLCPICKHPAITWELVEAIIADDTKIDRLIHGEDLFVDWSDCDCDEAIAIYISAYGKDDNPLSDHTRIREPIPPIGATYEWNDLWFETADQDICPICDSPATAITHSTHGMPDKNYQPSRNRICHNCKALKIGSQDLIWKNQPQYDGLDDLQKYMQFLQQTIGTWPGLFGSPNFKINWTDDMNKATIMWDAQAKVYKVTFGFLRDRKMFDNMIELLKKSIPSSERAWNKQLKLWLVSEAYLDVLKMVCEAYYNDVEVTEKEKVQEMYDNWEGNKYIEKPVIVTDELSIFTSALTQAGLSDSGSISSYKFDKTAEGDSERKRVKKLYQRAIMALHPDRNPANEDWAYKLNSSWQNLQDYFGFDRPKMEQLKD